MDGITNDKLEKMKSLGDILSEKNKGIMGLTDYETAIFDMVIWLSDADENEMPEQIEDIFNL